MGGSDGGPADGWAVVGLSKGDIVNCVAGADAYVNYGPFSCFSTQGVPGTARLYIGPISHGVRVPVPVIVAVRRAGGTRGVRVRVGGGSPVSIC